MQSVLAEQLVEPCQVTETVDEVAHIGWQLGRRQGRLWDRTVEMNASGDIVGLNDIARVSGKT
jgi:hypothetical protein